MKLTIWHSLTAEQAAAELKVDIKKGLASKEALENLEKFGRNEIKNGSQVSPIKIFLGQFKNVLVWILILAAAAAFFLGEIDESFAILAIVILSSFLGFFQEYKAENALLALKELSAPKTKVLRDGKAEIIDAALIAVGDIIILAAGDKISADCRLVEALDLQTDEASLTGESFPQDKNAQLSLAEKTPLADRLNLVFAGTSVVRGRATAVVYGTGKNTEIGKVANLLSSVKSAKTPLQDFLDKLGKKLAWLALAVILLITMLGVIKQQPLLEVLLLGISLAVAVVPEALPAVVTISLAIGVSRMAKKNALVRQLPMVEALGSVSVICTDKTGTLTKGEMTAVQVYTSQGFFEITGSGYEPSGSFILNNEKLQPQGELLELLRACALCGDAVLVHDKKAYKIEGDTTEGALVVMAQKGGIKKVALEEEYPRVGEIAFSSETKRMFTLHKNPNGSTLAFAKGAPESILPICSAILSGTKELALSDVRVQELYQIVEDFSAKGFRTIALAKKHDCEKNNCESQMVFLGLVALMDPPRVEAKNAVALCKQAGIRVVMITGDHPVTARSIGESLGLDISAPPLTGAMIDELGDAEFLEKVRTVQIYARVSPEHKLRIVKALQKHGQIVSMTGDGVNDAPALKQANIGVAMGISGTEVAKQAAGINLLDDNFATIVAAVKEGRGIFANIQKYLIYLLSSHLGEVILIGLSIIFSWPLPLTAVQILFVNLACDGPPALALAVEKSDSEVMHEPPRNSNQGLFTKPTVILFLVAAIWTTLINAAVLYWDWEIHNRTASASALTFISLVLVQFFKAYALRSIKPGNYKNLFSNKLLNWSVFGQVPILLAIVYIPKFQKIFSISHGFNFTEWMVVLVASASIFPVLEITKKVLARK